jgi:hypothetical protein
MSTVQKVNLEPLSNLLQNQIRDYALADKTLADPLNAVALVDGEWMTLNSSAQAIRASTIGSVGNAATILSFPLFAERGRTDIMAQADRKVPLIIFGDYEADTRIFDAAAVVGSGAAITTMFQGLKVATITLGSRNYTGLVGHGGAADANPIVAYVSKLPAVNGGKLRFMRLLGRL